MSRQPGEGLTADRRFRIGLAGIGAIVVVGTLGYRELEGWDWIESVYMTVITISTVGFREVRDLSPGGRIFTIALILGGVGQAAYLLSIVAESLVEGQVRSLFTRSAMRRAIEKMHNHVIVCGYGRFGRVVVDELAGAGTELVVIDQDASLEPELLGSGVGYVIGSAVSDDVLERARIHAARAIVVATSSEADNVFITLAARELNPRIRVHARGESEAGVRRLRRAGAHHVTSPFQMGGLRTAASILRPAVVDFLELSSHRHDEAVDLEEIEVAVGASLAGREVADVEREVGRLRIVAQKRGEEPIRLVPEPGARLEPGDYLVVIGDCEALARLAHLAQPAAATGDGGTAS